MGRRFLFTAHWSTKLSAYACRRNIPEAPESMPESSVGLRLLLCAGWAFRPFDVARHVLEEAFFEMQAAGQCAAQEPAGRSM
jgi:hypothetical protein